MTEFTTSTARSAAAAVAAEHIGFMVDTHTSHGDPGVVLVTTHFGEHVLGHPGGRRTFLKVEAFEAFVAAARGRIADTRIAA